MSNRRRLFTQNRQGLWGLVGRQARGQPTALATEAAAVHCTAVFWPSLPRLKQLFAVCDKMLPLAERI